MVSLKRIAKSTLTNLVGPPGTGKSVKIIQITRFLQSRKTKVILTTQTNAATLNLFRMLLETDGTAKRIIYPISLPVKLESEIPTNKFPKFNIATTEFSQKVDIIIGTTYQIETHVTDDTLKLATVILDEAGMLSWHSVKRCAIQAKKLILCGDKKQLQPYMGEKSIIEKLEKYAEITVILNTTYRLNQPTVKFLRQIYPDLKAEYPHQNMKIGNIKLSGILNLPFTTYSAREGTSCYATNEANMLLKMKQIIQKKANADVILCSPYLAMKSGGITTINSIQGRTCDVLILSLTNEKVTEFVLEESDPAC